MRLKKHIPKYSFGKMAKQLLLNILIPTIESRKDQYQRLRDRIQAQIDSSNAPVKIISLIDSAKMLVGQKRNILLEHSTAKYVIFCDDDDNVPHNYIHLLVKAARENKDCANLIGQITTNGVNPQRFEHSIKYDSWFTKDNIHYRPPNHLNMIRSSIAKQFKFPEINRGEDMDWSMQIQKSGLLKTEAQIEDIIYFYLFDTNKTATQARI